MHPLLLLGLSSPAKPVTMPTFGTGTQSITIMVSEVPPSAKIMAERVGSGVLSLEGSGNSLYGTFQGDPARFMQLRLSMENQGRHQLFEGVLPLADAYREVLAFTVVGEGPQAHALRVPDAPVAAPDVAVDPRVGNNIRFGWGALVMLYVVSLIGTASVVTERMRNHLKPEMFRRWVRSMYGESP
jgi:hypothetical protein